jgi:hypothetical protein
MAKIVGVCSADKDIILLITFCCRKNIPNVVCLKIFIGFSVGFTSRKGTRPDGDTDTSAEAPQTLKRLGKFVFGSIKPIVYVK